MRKQILAKIFRTAFVCFVVFVVCSSATASVFQKIEVRDGTLYFEDGREVVFWGVNFQPSLSWEYGRMANHGLHMPFEMEAYQTMIDEAFDELQMMGCNLIRSLAVGVMVAERTADDLIRRERLRSWGIR